jgi:hypothetical protein
MALKGYQRGKTQCEAVSQDKWECSPHSWVRCQHWAQYEREGLKVCRNHRDTRIICAFDIPHGDRPHWNEWKAERKRVAEGA